MNIAFVDLKTQYQRLKPEMDAAIQGVLENTAFIGGEHHRQFEAEFADYCNVQACAAVGNGTDAVYLALRALGVGQNDEVITVSHTFIGSTEPITLLGATPVFVDIDPETMLIDPKQVEQAITPNTKAILAVHLYGQCCDMTQLSEIAERHGLKLIEDAAQAHGARWLGKRTGGLGHAACFSFYPGKNLGAYGDGGAVVSDDAELIARVRALANHGRQEKYTHSIEGVNSRLDGLQAAVLRVKLPHLDAWNAARTNAARRYNELLSDTPISLPTVDKRCEPVWHLYVIRVGDRETVQATLKEQGVPTGVHYPVPLHRQPAYAWLNQRSLLPNTEQAAEQILSLPMHPEMTDAMLEHVARALRSCPNEALTPRVAVSVAA